MKFIVFLFNFSLLLIQLQLCFSFVKVSHPRLTSKETKFHLIPQRISDYFGSNSNLDRLKLVTTISIANILLTSSPVRADSIEDCNNRLANYGLPPIIFLPPGLTPIVQEYGLQQNYKGNELK
jgi:hypothetical protein